MARPQPFRNSYLNSDLIANRKEWTTSSQLLARICSQNIKPSQLLKSKLHEPPELIPGNSRTKKVLFTCLSQSITGELKTTLFGLEGHLPAHQDRPTLFKNMLDSTLTSSMMVSIQAMTDLNNLDPSEFDYSIMMIEVNKRASHLFTLATTTNRVVPDTERYQRTKKRRNERKKKKGEPEEMER